MKHGKWLNQQVMVQYLAVLDAKLAEARKAGDGELVRKIERLIEKTEVSSRVFEEARR